MCGRRHPCPSQLQPCTTSPPPPRVSALTAGGANSGCLRKVYRALVQGLMERDEVGEVGVGGRCDWGRDLATVVSCFTYHLS